MRGSSQMNVSIGLIVNPVAGLGGRLAQKGSDASDIRDLAKRAGIDPWLRNGPGKRSGGCWTGWILPGCRANPRRRRRNGRRRPRRRHSPRGYRLGRRPPRGLEFRRHQINGAEHGEAKVSTCCSLPGETARHATSSTPSEPASRCWASPQASRSTPVSLA